MKKLCLILLCLLVGNSVVLFAQEKNLNHVNNATTNKNLIQVNAKDRVFTIKIPSNITTGYKLFLKNYDHQLLTLISNQYMAAKSNGMVGVPGVEEWKFRLTSNALLAPQVTEITFVNMRPWDADSMSENKYTVVIN